MLSADDLTTQFEAYRSMLIAHARLAVNDLDIAEDLAQETFLTALECLSRYKRRHALRAWLLSILNNHLLNAVRTRSRHQAMVDRLGDVIMRDGGKVQFGEMRDAAMRLLRLADLTPRQVECLRLRIDGDTPHHIGKRLKIAVPTVHRHISSGVKRLKETSSDILEEADIDHSILKRFDITRYFAPTTVGAALARERLAKLR